MQIRNLVVTNLVETCRRLMQLSSNAVGGCLAADLDEDGANDVQPSLAADHSEVEFVSLVFLLRLFSFLLTAWLDVGPFKISLKYQIGALTKNQEFVERQSIRSLLHFGRTFIQFLDVDEVRFQVMLLDNYSFALIQFALWMVNILRVYNNKENNNGAEEQMVYKANLSSLKERDISTHAPLSTTGESNEPQS